MAKSVKKETTEAKDKNPSKNSNRLKQYKVLLGFVLVLSSIALLLSFISFFIHGQNDQSAVNDLSDRNEVVGNWLGKFGAYVSNLFIYM